MATRERAAMTVEAVFDLWSVYVTGSGRDDWGENEPKGEASGGDAGGW